MESESLVLLEAGRWRQNFQFCDKHITATPGTLSLTSSPTWSALRGRVAVDPRDASKSAARFLRDPVEGPTLTDTPPGLCGQAALALEADPEGRGDEGVGEWAGLSLLMLNEAHVLESSQDANSWFTAI